MVYRLVIPRELSQSQMRSGLSRSKREARQVSSKEFIHIPVHEHHEHPNHDDEIVEIVDQEQREDEMTVMKPKEEHNHHRIHELHETGHSKKYMMNLLHKEKMGHVPFKH